MKTPAAARWREQKVTIGKKRGPFDENAAIDVLMKVTFFSPGWTKRFVI